MSPKRSVRQDALAARDALPASARSLASDAIAAHVSALPEWARARMVAAYAPIGSEVDTRPVLSRALDAGLTVALPRSVPGERALEFHAVSSLDALAPGLYAIPEPPADTPRVTADDVDVVLVPGVAWDENGHRLGYGHGYFDRFLHRVRAFKVGLAFEAQVRDALPVAGHDVPVDALVTEKRVLRVDSSG